MDIIGSGLELLTAFGQKVFGGLPIMLACAAVFTVVELVAKSRFSRGPWWRKPELPTDLLYVFLVPALLSYVKLFFIIAAAYSAASLFSDVDGARYIDEGRGFLAGLPFWAQIVVYFIATDIMMYWSHRIFHGPDLWRYHAIHHSPEHLDWISAFRFHPVNTLFHSVLADAVMLMCGISPAVIIMLAPFQVFMSAFVHADVDWDLGPFKYVIASPVFHRWHHTDVARGGEKNFAPTFPVIDIVFGTFYMPKGAVPDSFGVDDPHFPKSIEGQMAYPFVKPKAGVPAE